VDYNLFVKSQLTRPRLTLRPYVVQIWTRNTLEFRGGETGVVLRVAPPWPEMFCCARATPVFFQNLYQNRSDEPIKWHILVQNCGFLKIVFLDIGQVSCDACDLIRTSIYDKYSGSMKITTRLDQISHRKISSGTNWSNSWTYRVFLINTHRD